MSKPGTPDNPEKSPRKGSRKKSRLADGTPWPNYRSPHRRRADREAHAEGGGAKLPPVIDHPLVVQGPPAMVDTPEALAELVEKLRGEPRFGFDTEFIGEESFYLRFCVVQVSTPDGLTLIDALAPGMDLLPFWELVADPSIEKIVHAGLQDLEPVARLTGRPPAAVYDTQIAAAFMGKMYPISLKNLCLEALEADLGTSGKFSQWDRRPLTPLQQGYAANDVRYLLLLRQHVGDELEQRGHTEKAAVECTQFADPDTYRIDPLTMKLKAKGRTGGKRSEQAIINALLLWRAEAARERDLPMRVLLDDQTLVDLSQRPVKSVDDVQKFKGMPWPVKEAYAQDLVDATAAALAGPMPPRAPRYKPLSEEGAAQLASVWSAAQAACAEAEIAATLVMNKREITELVRARDRNHPAPINRLAAGWRRALLEPVLGDLLPGQSAAG